ncbi:hypothetical protein [uncultured Roseobacter sp.]|uniref:hypothetical protein n=1 Tax=uncultured Roseobacter sp. TaxID=114847 RepID=UPI00261EA772|nr:hypothetical protein [uncultured Roseobacter sp.]
MFARVTHYKMKAASVAPATALLEQMKPQIMALPGLIRFINTMNSDGSGCVISIVESREASDANAENVAKLWSAFADHLESAPSAEGFEVIADWAD